MATPTADVKNFLFKGACMGHLTFFKILNPINIYEMDEATLFKFVCGSTTASPTPRVQNFPPKGA